MDTSLVQEYNVDKNTFSFEKSWIGRALGSNTIYINEEGLSLFGENWGIEGITLENIYLFDNNLCVGLNCGSLQLNQISFKKQNNYSLYSILNQSGKDGDIYFPNSIVNGITSGNTACFYALISNTKLAEQDNELVSGNFIIKLESNNNIVFQNITPSYNLTSLKISPLSAHFSLRNFVTEDYEKGAKVKIKISLLSGNIKLYKKNISESQKISSETTGLFFIKSLTKIKYNSEQVVSVLEDKKYIKDDVFILYDQTNLFFNETYHYTIVLKNIVTGEETTITESILTAPAPPKKVYIESNPFLSLYWDNYSYMNTNNIDYNIYLLPYDISGISNENNIYTSKGLLELTTIHDNRIQFLDLLPGRNYQFDISCKNDKCSCFKKYIVNTSFLDLINIDTLSVNFNLSLYKENNLYKACIDFSGDFLFYNNEPATQYIIYDRYKKIETVSVDNIVNNKVILNRSYESLPELYINVIATNINYTNFSNVKETKVVNFIDNEDIYVPSSPINFKAIGGENKIVLSWESNNYNNVSYSIYKVNGDTLTLIKSFIEELTYIEKNLLEETSYYYAIRSYNKLGEYSEFSYTNATTLDFVEPPINFKVKTNINAATIFLNTFNKSMYQPKYSIFCSHNNHTWQITSDENINKINIHNLIPNTEYKFLVQYWFKDRDDMKSFSITKSTLSNYNKYYNNVNVFKNVLKETNENISWELNKYPLYNYTFSNFTMQLPSHFYIKWKEYLINPINPTIITLKNIQPYLNFVNGDIIAVFSLQNKVCLDVYVWNEIDNRKTLYCSQSNENYGISNNELELSFQVWRSSSGVIEPLFVSHYELLNDKMEIVESNIKKLSIIKNGPLEGLYNNIILKPCKKHFKIYKNGTFYQEISYLNEIEYSYNLNDNIENYTITQYYSVYGDCYSYDYNEHYESDGWENKVSNYQITNLNINVETERQINFYNEIKTKQI